MVVIQIPATVTLTLANGKAGNCSCTIQKFESVQYILTGTTNQCFVKKKKKLPF